MTVTVSGVGTGPRGAPAVVVSPLVELGSALHVLSGCPHGLDDWAADTRSTFGPELARATEAWSWATQAIRAAPFLTSEPVPDFADALGSLAARPAADLVDGLLRPLARGGGLAGARRWGRSRGGEVARMVDLLVDDPARARSRFLAFLESTWQAWFAAEWATSLPVLSERAARLRALIAATDLWGALASLDPAVTVHPDQGMVAVAKVQSRRHDVRHRGLAVAPSRFISPHVYVGDIPGEPLVLVVAADTTASAPRAPTPTELLSRVRLLSSPSTLEVARAIATEPRTAGEVTALWGLDVTQVTRQLRALERAGLAVRSRHGRYVRYSLRLDFVDAVGHDLAELILR